MSVAAAPLPLRFQLGARTLASISRTLARVPLSLDDAIDARLPALPPLPAGADGYSVTSLPAERVAALAYAAPGLIAHVRQRYMRYWIDLTIGADAWMARMSPGTRSALKRKAKKLAATAGGALDVRRFRTPDEITAFHGIARAISARTYQARLLGGGMPDDARFTRAMLADAAAGRAWGWLLYVGGEPAAYLYCPVVGGNVIYDQVGHDPAFAALSPGAVLQAEALRDLFAAGTLARFDFTEGEGQHKASAATHGVACVDLLLLRATLANRAALTTLAAFDRGAALAKQTVQRLGLEAAAKRIRR